MNMPKLIILSLQCGTWSYEERLLDMQPLHLLLGSWKMFIWTDAHTSSWNTVSTVLMRSSRRAQVDQFLSIQSICEWSWTPHLKADRGCRFAKGLERSIENGSGSITSYRRVSIDLRSFWLFSVFECISLTNTSLSWPDDDLSCRDQYSAKLVTKTIGLLW